MATDDKSRFRTDLAVIIPTVTAVVVGGIGFGTSSFVSYINNQGTLKVEQQKEKAESELERQKFKTSLILEAVRVGDRQKAIDNLTFFIDAGFLDDPEGRIKGLLNRNVSPVLPNPRATKTDDAYSFDGPASAEQIPATGDRAVPILRARQQAMDMIRRGDEFAANGNVPDALASYEKAVFSLEVVFGSSNRDDINAIRKKIDQLQNRK